MKPNYLLLLYVALAAVQVLAEWIAETTSAQIFVYIFKPLMMPALALAYWAHCKQALNGFHKIILAALLFSWFGDMFLLFLNVNANLMFLLGLSSFLIAHIFYIVAFTKTKTSLKQGYALKQPGLLIVVFGFGFLLLSSLFVQNLPAFVPMQVPVVVYALVIVTMVVMAYNRRGLVPAKSFALVITGAVMFALSDSIIALNNFTLVFESNKHLARIAIMALYLAGQYYIVTGCLTQFNLIKTS